MYLAASIELSLLLVRPWAYDLFGAAFRHGLDAMQLLVAGSNCGNNTVGACLADGGCGYRPAAAAAGGRRSRRRPVVFFAA